VLPRTKWAQHPRKNLKKRGGGPKELFVLITFWEKKLRHGLKSRTKFLGGKGEKDQGLDGGTPEKELGESFFERRDSIVGPDHWKLRNRKKGGMGFFCTKGCLGRGEKGLV